MTVLVEELMAAVKSNDAAKVSYLLVQHPELVNAKSGENSAILSATYYGANDVINVLLENGAELNLFEACAVGKTDKVLDFLGQDCGLVHTYSHDGFQALGLAAFFGHLDTVKALLYHGAQVNTPSKNPMKVMPLHSSVAHRHVEISELLIGHGADVNAKQKDGFTPLLEAVHNGQIEMVRLFIAGGADVNLAKDDGQTPLAMANETGHREIATLLQQNGASE